MGGAGEGMGEGERGTNHHELLKNEKNEKKT